MIEILEEDYGYIINNIPWNLCEGKTFLITGITGFLAGYLVDLLMYMNRYVFKKECNVIGLCRNIEKAEKRFEKHLGKNMHFTLVEQEISVPMEIDDHIDYIIHAASSTSTADFERIPVEILDANIIGTKCLLDIAKEKDIISFLFLSSGAVYGDIPENVKEIKETEAYQYNYYDVKSCYTLGKRAGEIMCLAYNKEYNIPAKIVRVSHTYGPGINLKDGHVYSDFVSCIVQGRKIEIKGDGKAYRPFCYISDAMIAFFLILLCGRNGEAYNMANTEETWTIWELANILAVGGFPERHIEISAPNILNNDVCKKLVNIDKLKKIGWIPQIGVIEGFRRTVEFYSES